MQKTEKFLLAAIIISATTLSLLVPQSGQAAQGPNLVPNPDFEITGSNGLPADWIKGRWGTNTAVFEYPATGLGNSKAAKVTLTNHVSGDAKWAFPRVAVTPGKSYDFHDYYVSNVSTYLTIEYEMTDGRLTYQDIAAPGPQSTFQKVSATLVVPSNVKSMRVFHLINKTGSLTVDGFFLGLSETSPPPPPPATDNLISNPSLELQTGSLPTDWAKGRWGTNTAIFTYPAESYSGAKGAKIEMTSRTTGDAKWYFKDIFVSPGTNFLFSNYYRSNVETWATARYLLSNGSYLYKDLGLVPATDDPTGATWQQFQSYFVVPANAVSLTIFHLINKVGYLETDNYSLKKITQDTTPHFGKGIISLNFDDGTRSAYENGIPIVNAAGFKTSQFIVTDYVLKGFPGYVTKSEILNMQTQGHEIGAHTMSHLDLTSLSSSEAQAQITGSRDELIKMGVTSPIESFVYPFGAYNPQVEQLVENAGFSSARTTETGYNLKAQNLFALKAISVTTNMSISSIKNYIDTALANKAWLIFSFHRIDNSGGTYSNSPETLQQIVDYLKQTNASVMTTKEVVNLIKN